MRALLCLAAMTSAAAAEPLTSSVAKMTPDPGVLVVAKRAGKTPLERYRAGPGLVAANTPLVALVKLNEANGPDVVSVADAHRDGSTITIAIDNRRYDGALDKNLTWVPLVEVELGALKPGTYTFQIDERILHFTDDPKNAKFSSHGLTYKATLAIQ